MHIAESLLKHLEETFPHYQFEGDLMQRIVSSAPHRRFRIKFYRPHDHYGRIEIVGDSVELWARLNPSDSWSHKVEKVYQFSLAEPDSTLWIERFVGAGLDRWKIDLTKPLPTATGDCDDGWKREGDESLVYSV